MTEHDEQIAPIKHSDKLPPALLSALALWADATTDTAMRRRDEVRQAKQKTVAGFFAHVRKLPGEVEPDDVKGWQRELEKKLRPATVYVRLSLLSSFYTWAHKHVELSRQVRDNPVRLARPRAPRAYQTESVKSFTDEELAELINHVKEKADAPENLIAKRDYALLRLYVATGLRREEVIGLKGDDVRVTDVLTIMSRVKGGNYRAREVRDVETKDALIDYLTAAKRLHVLKTDAPLWTRHDCAKLAGEKLTSHAFVRNLKLYAKAAGLGDVHLHQTRHTFGRIVAEETGSMSLTQDALDHKNRQTTRAYVQRILVKRDLYSERVAERLRRRKVDTED